MAFLVETLPDGRCVVFVPVAPTPSIGFVYIAPPEDVERIDASTSNAMNCMMQWGMGAGSLIGSPVVAPTPGRPEE